jgi:hypothetical protein
MQIPNMEIEQQILQEVKTNKPKFIEGINYYYNEQGLMVMTVIYHLKRGECCKSGCLHCPWSFQKQK